MSFDTGGEHISGSIADRNSNIYVAYSQVFVINGTARQLPFTFNDTVILSAMYN